MNDWSTGWCFDEADNANACAEVLRCHDIEASVVVSPDDDGYLVKFKAHPKDERWALGLIYGFACAREKGHTP